MTKTEIVLEDNKFSFQETSRTQLKKNNFFIINLIVFLCLFISTIYTILIGFNWKPLKTLEKFKSIKKNMNSWTSVVTEKTGIEKNKGRSLYLSRPDVSVFKCVDFGSYYSPGRISSSNYLPEFIRRGNSGPWIVTKAANTDLSALQFCEYLINEYVTNSTNLDNIITCGIQMQNILGYSGYFIPNSPCERMLESI